ncbi:MAG: hypothetical protein WCH60_17355 [Burkholderiales bacterium]
MLMVGAMDDKVGGYSPLQAATGLFWINVGMLVVFWFWGGANPWLARNGFTARRLMAWGIPLSLALFAILLIASHAFPIGVAAILVLYCAASSVCSFAQPEIALAFRAELAGRALSAYNLVIFCGVFAVQWGIGLLVDGLRALQWSEVAAYQGAMSVFGVCCIAAYLHFLRAK